MQIRQIYFKSAEFEWSTDKIKGTSPAIYI